jgi:hypothetical protein
MNSSWLFIFFLVPPLLKIMAPPYFSDSLRYHYPIIQSVKNLGGLYLNPYDWESQIVTTFFPEMTILPFAYLPIVSAGPLYIILFFLTLHRIKCYLREELSGENRMILFITMFILFSTDIFMQAYFYHKTEAIIYYIQIEWIVQFRRWEKNRGSLASLWILTSFLAFFKISNAVILFPFFIYILCKSKKIWLGTKNTIIIFIPILLFLLNNYNHHGQLLFPFFYDKNQLPVVLFDNLKHHDAPFLKALNFLENSFLSFNHRHHFKPMFLSYWVIIFISANLFKHHFQPKKVINLLMSLTGFIIILIIHKDPPHAFRLGFGSILIYLLCHINLLKQLKRITLFWICLFTGLTATIPTVYNLRIIPGIKLHFMKDSITDYYRKLDYHNVIDFKSEDITKILSSEKSLIYTPMPYFFSNANITHGSPNTKYLEGHFSDFFQKIRNDRFKYLGIEINHHEQYESIIEKVRHGTYPFRMDCSKLSSFLAQGLKDNILDVKIISSSLIIFCINDEK